MAELDRERILAKLDGDLGELRVIAPQTFDEYSTIEKKRACERLLQVSVEAVIDVCHRLVSGLRLGLPAEEDDLFRKLREAAVFSEPMEARLREIRGFRSILVHEYAHVNDRLVFEAIQQRLEDSGAFKHKQEVLTFLRGRSGP